MTALITGNVYVVRTTLARAPKHKPEQASKDKIVLCISANDKFFFWFNTSQAHHGIGQLPVQPTQAPGLVHDCFLDLSRLTTFPPAELANAKDCGTASRELLIKVISTLNEGIRTLTQRQINSAVSSLFACIKPICVQLPEDTGELSSERRSYGEIPGGGAAARGRRFESTFAVSPGKYSRR